MNTRVAIASILNLLKKLDQQGNYKIADKIFNNLKTAQEVKVEIKYRIDGESNIKYYFKNFSEDLLQIAGTSTAQLN